MGLYFSFFHLQSLKNACVKIFFDSIRICVCVCAPPRFTELYVEELENEGDLRILVSDYLKGLNLQKTVISGIIRSAMT